MPLSTSWEPTNTLFYPSDNRFWQILKMAQGFQHYFKRQHQQLPQGSPHPSQIDITGSTAWLWYLLSSSPHNATFIYHCLSGTTTDIDLRNVIRAEKAEKTAQYYKEYLALHDLAFHEYQGRHEPPEKKEDYAQIKFTASQYGPRGVDWTITTIAKAPLHNYDILCNINRTEYNTVKFNVPSFAEAKDARENNQFLLNPAIFQINDGMSIINYAEFEENFTPNKDVNVGKTIACVLKTICKISMAGITLADYTMRYLNALVKTPFITNNPAYAFNNIQNPTMLQATCYAFYHSYYKFASLEDKYIFENVLASLSIQMPDGEKTLYQVFRETIKAQVFRYLDDEKFLRLISTPKEAVSPTLQQMVSLLKPVTIAPAADSIVPAQDITVQEAPIPAAADLTPVAATLPDTKPQTENTAEKQLKKKKAKSPDNSAPAETKTPAQPIIFVPEASPFLPPQPAATSANTKPAAPSFASIAARAAEKKSPQTTPVANPKPQPQNTKTDSYASKAKQNQAPQQQKIASKGWN